jgi:ABC-type Na+ efflux pump permease subunit
MLLMVVMAAAGKVSLERERMTLDGLLTSPLRTGEILGGKLAGALAVVRPMRWALLTLCVLAVATGHVVALPLVAANWLALACFLGVTGLWCSQESRSTVQATVKTLAVFLLMMAGAPIAVDWAELMTTPWFSNADLYAGFAGSLLTPWQSHYQLITTFGHLMDLGHMLGAPSRVVRQPSGWALDNALPIYQFAGAVCSPLLYGGLAYLLWRPLCRRFDKAANRLPGASNKHTASGGR